MSSRLPASPPAKTQPRLARLGAWLARRLSPTALAPAPTTDIAAGLARLEQQIAALEQQLAAHGAANGATSPPAAEPPPLAEMQATLARLEKHTSRTGREQVKANSLAEMQHEQLHTALEMLRAADEHREQELATQHQQAARAARLDVAHTLLPILDGMDEALRSGAALLARTPPEAAPARPGLWARLQGSSSAPSSPQPALHEGMLAWLEGLRLLQQRLLDVLAAEDVYPIVAHDVPFDPHQHSALDIVPADESHPDGQVAEELRRGYRHGNHVVRHAEVIVARAAPAASHAPTRDERE